MGSKTITTEEFIKRSCKIWGNKYDYSKTKYVNQQTVVRIKCKIHNCEFEQKPHSHYIHEGCPVCSREHKYGSIDTIINKRFVSNEGYSFVIIRGTVKKDLTIQFENGAVKEHVNYANIILGKVRHPSPNLGEVNISLSGQLMTIIRQNGCKDITVQFSDGTIVEHRQYIDFLRGAISNPNCKNIKGVSLPEIAVSYYLSQIGFNKAPRYSLPEIGTYELDAYNPDVNGHKVAVEYDGYPWHLDPEPDVTKNIACIQNNIKLYRIRELGLPQLGKEVTEYVLTSPHKNDIDAIYTIVSNVVKLINRDCGTSFSIVKTAEDKDNIFELMNSYYYAHREQRLGETRIMNNSLKATIIAYRLASDVDIQFETGEVINNTSYSCFKKGDIALPDTNTGNLKAKQRREGAKYQSNIYGEITITRYSDSNNMDIECSSGEKFYHISYAQFYRMCHATGKLFDKLAKQRIGETAIATNGQKMAIIAYHGFKNVDIQFEDGTKVLHKDYYAFQRGLICNPNFADSYAGKRYCPHPHGVILTDIAGKQTEFDTIVAAAVFLNVHTSTVHRALKGSGYCKGYKIENAV